MSTDGETFTQTGRKRQIIAAAIETIAELGYARASFAEIATRAGVTRTIIPYYFSNKDALIRQILIDIFMGGVGDVQQKIEAAATPTDKIATLIRASIAHIATHAKEMAAAQEIIAHASRKTIGPLLDPAAADPRIAGLEHILADGQKTGEFRNFTPRFMAIAIMQAIDGVHTARKQDPNFNTILYGEELVTLFMRAIQNNDHKKDQ